MYNRERIEEVIRECLKYYTMGDSKTDKDEKENFVESVMLELDNKWKTIAKIPCVICMIPKIDCEELKAIRSIKIE